jgi:DNA-binding transcriptional regulator YiaG
MPNIGHVFKTEIVRLARREAKALTEPLRKDLRASRRAAVALRRELAQVKKQVAELSRRQPAADAAQPAAPASSRAWISGKGVRALRRKLGVTQQDFAKLARVSPIAVFKWEKQDGKLLLRRKSLANVMALRGLGAREARARLSGKA